MIRDRDFITRVRANFSSFEEVELFIQISLLITILPVLIKLLSIPRLMKVLTPGDLKAYKNADLEKTKDKIVKFTDYILGRNFWIYKTKCLKRSLVLYHFLRKIGINVNICFGVRYGEEGGKKKLDGHAWLVYNGDIFLEKNVQMTKTYKVTYCFPEVREQIAQEAILKQS
jgi:hypothetical protein